MLVTLFLVSVVSFIIIQLPPGDWLDSYVARMSEQGSSMSREQLQAMRTAYGLDAPLYVQYFKWIGSIIFHNDWGMSLEAQTPVKTLIWNSLGLTMAIALATMLLSWIFAIAAGVYSATHQYSVLDYVLNLFSFVGVGTPGFMLALVVMWLAVSRWGINIGGLYSPEYVNAPMNWAKFFDALKHLIVPVVLLAFSASAETLRITRGQLLDELNKPYVETARAKGLNERKVIWKYPVRLALKPFFSTAGWTLGNLISGSLIVTMVLNLPTLGPLFLFSLLNQDMFLAGSIVLLLSSMTVIGTMISDIILVYVDPRIKLQG
jgi:peptide/nickel transport system permease protein